jgi:hypothetical protein
MRHAYPFVFLALLAATPVRAQVDPEALEAWGGTFLSDCAKASSPRIVVSANAITYMEGDRKVVSKTVTSAASWYGNSAPEGHLMTFLGDMADGDQVIVDVLQTDGRTWAKIDGGGSVQKRLGKAALGRQYLRCGDAKPAPDAKATTDVPVPESGLGTAPALPGAADYAMDPAFAVPYKKALGKYAGEHWLQTLQGPSPETRKVTIAGTEYVLIAACKDHDCADNNTTLLWNPGKKTVFGKVRVLGKSALIGNPPKEVQKDLGDLWWKQWGQNSQ